MWLAGKNIYLFKTLVLIPFVLTNEKFKFKHALEQLQLQDQTDVKIQ